MSSFSSHFSVVIIFAAKGLWFCYWCSCEKHLNGAYMFLIVCRNGIGEYRNIYPSSLPLYPWQGACTLACFSSCLFPVIDGWLKHFYQMFPLHPSVVTFPSLHFPSTQEIFNSLLWLFLDLFYVSPQLKLPLHL